MANESNDSIITKRERNDFDLVFDSIDIRCDRYAVEFTFELKDSIVTDIHKVTIKRGWTYDNKFIRLSFEPDTPHFEKYSDVIKVAGRFGNALIISKRLNHLFDIDFCRLVIKSTPENLLNYDKRVSIPCTSDLLVMFSIPARLHIANELVENLKAYSIAADIQNVDIMIGPLSYTRKYDSKELTSLALMYEPGNVNIVWDKVAKELFESKATKKMLGYIDHLKSIAKGYTKQSIDSAKLIIYPDNSYDDNPSMGWCIVYNDSKRMEGLMLHRDGEWSTHT